MSITRYDPGTIWLGGPSQEVNDLAAAVAIRPGMLVEQFNAAGVIRLRPHVTAAGSAVRMVACEQSMLNKGVDDLYAINDLVEAREGGPGASFWMLIASGQTIVAGDKLESAGDGTLKIVTAGFGCFSALENKTAVALTRIRVEVL